MVIAKYAPVTVQLVSVLVQSKRFVAKESSGKDVINLMSAMSYSVRLLHSCRSPSRHQGAGVASTILGVKTRVMSSSK